MCLVQTKKGKRREQQGHQIYWSFGKWQCNVTQGHCTATTYFAPLYDLVMCCCPFHPPTPNQSPLAPCQNPPPSTSSFFCVSTPHCHLMLFPVLVEPDHCSGFNDPRSPPSSPPIPSHRFCLNPPLIFGFFLVLRFSFTVTVILTVADAPIIVS